jgi:ABC-type sugar transport system ATPase subunit
MSAAHLTGMDQASTAEQPALEAMHVAKSFGAVRALTDASLVVWPGEVVGLIGDNAAGKSTLIKCISGRLHADAGTFRVGGKAFRATSPAAARAQGIEVVYQSLALVDTVDIASNLFLGREPVYGRGPLRHLGLLRVKQMRAETARTLEEVGVNLRGASMTDTVEHLSGGQRQGIAVGRAVVWGQKVVLLDEPAAALGVEQTRHVLHLVRRLKERGVGVVFISHTMQQVLEVCDRVTIMRQGRTVGSVVTTEASGEDLVSYMTGTTQPPG